MPGTDPSTPNSNLPDFKENVRKLLSDIQELQKMEQDHFNQLNTNGNLTPQQQMEQISQINKTSNMRRNLYTTLSQVNSFYKDALDSSMGTLKEQKTAISIVENELNRAKKRLEYLELQKNNKIRLVEINQFFGEKYSEHTKLMKIIIFILIPIIILTMLYKKNIIPKNVYFILFIIIGVVGAFFVYKLYASIIMRDNMNYNEYDWPFDIKSAPTADTTTSTSDPWAASSTFNFGTCIGQNCCSTGLTYDTTTNLCIVPGTTTSTGQESFQTRLTPANFSINETEIQNALTKTQPGKYKADVNLAPYSAKAYNS
jgi:hypothetical protein